MPEQSVSVGSERLRLARLARAAALRVPGVYQTDIGPMGLFVTVDRGERVEGVTCVATRGGGYEVSLRLVCELISLMRLGEEVRAGVTRAALAAEIPLDSVSVHVAEIADAGDQ